MSEATRRVQSDGNLVWLDTIRSVPPARDGVGGMYIRGLSGGKEIHRLSDFHLDIKKSEFFEDFDAIDNPEGNVVRFDDGRLPGSAWEFDFNLRFKPLGKNGK